MKAYKLPQSVNIEFEKKNAHSLLFSGSEKCGQLGGTLALYLKFWSSNMKMYVVMTITISD